jgi:ankyrin repeat protein
MMPFSVCRNPMYGRTSPLHEAARAGHTGVVRLLLDAGADPMLRDGAGKTALEIAVEGNRGGVVDLLRSVMPPS